MLISQTAEVMLGAKLSRYTNKVCISCGSDIRLQYTPGRSFNEDGDPEGFLGCDKCGLHVKINMQKYFDEGDIEVLTCLKTIDWMVKRGDSLADL